MVFLKEREADTAVTACGKRFHSECKIVSSSTGFPGLARQP